MKRKKIIIFFLYLMLVISEMFVVLRIIFVTKGEVLNSVNYKSENLIVCTPKQGKNEKLIILGSGYSLSIDEKNRIIKHDPLMILPSVKEYGEDTTVMSIFYPFESDGLEAAGKELSGFINKELDNYDEITLIGHSKCGVHFANMARWIEGKINIVTISAPFMGTPVTNKEEFLENLSWAEKKIYTVIFSNHKVDQDIGINSAFIKNADYSGLMKHNHINIISTCPKKANNPIDMFLISLDKWVDGDGIVPKKSQKVFFDGTIQKEIEATHATSLKKGIELIKKDIPNLLR